ncbi:MAG: hypothetical protein IJ702_01485 [Fretibacterium sp.]|nr:hypothetical protein [Fretibacterium sp.]
MMWILLAFVAFTVFLLGLLQWARSGAGIWQIFTLRRRERALSGEEREKAKGEIRRLERSSDRALLASFRMLGFLALGIWVVLLVIMVINFLGMGNWMDNHLNTLSLRARSYWNTGLPDNGPQSTPERQNILRNMGVNLRK